MLSSFNFKIFYNAIILYGSSFPETAATQNCGRPRGISLTSLLHAAAFKTARTSSVLAETRRRPGRGRAPLLACGREAGGEARAAAVLTP